MFRKILLGKAAFDRVQAMMFTPVNALPVGGEAASPEDVVVCCERPVAMPFKSAAPGGPGAETPSVQPGTKPVEASTAHQLINCRAIRTSIPPRKIDHASVASMAMARTVNGHTVPPNTLSDAVEDC